MTALHAHFHLRNQQAFQRLLDPSPRPHTGGPSTSGGKSWSRPSPLSSAHSLDVNARDHLGRTVLHLAAASQDASAPEFVRLLLAHPNINVNIPDTESHWTPLHRALYHGNLATAQLLLQRLDIDTTLRDIEGYTPFDLYNSTIEGTVPDHDAPRGHELYTWGSNRNAALGVGDADDRALPELISLRVSPVERTEKVDARFTPIRVRQVAMSKLHTVIVTDEPRGNMRVCGFGSGGRLGPGQHTQYTPVPIPGFNLAVESVAVGQDHTLILTKNGEVHSWGLNRFSQLGYVVETVTGGRAEEPIQLTPRKIGGAIRNRVIEGVAACKIASVCWTGDEVFTWGTNHGQLGYDRAAQPVQIAPRVVTKINKPVLSVSITDSALACLLETKEVMCIWNDGYFKVNFPAYSFPIEFVVYRPPQAASRDSIDKITSCEGTFAALSSSGEVFTFTCTSPPDGGANGIKSRFNVQPQRVWALRKQFSAVRDVALGADGSIIICTESGHVFVRTRNLKAGQSSSVKTFRFQRIPYVQRVTRVCANATGAFAALREDFHLKEVEVIGNRFPQDMATVQPYLKFNCSNERGSSSGTSGTILSPSVETPSWFREEDEEDSAVEGDVKQLRDLASVIVQLKETRKGTNPTRALDYNNMPYHADLIVNVQSADIELPAHRVILAARSAVLGEVFANAKSIRNPKSTVSIQGHVRKDLPSPKLTKITFAGCHPLSVLILFVYLYSDEVLAVWDPRVSHVIRLELEQLKVQPSQLKAELQALSSLLGLRALSDVLDAPVKRTPMSILSEDMQKLYSLTQSEGVGIRVRPLAPDVVLHLADHEVFCHSVVLRARSPFFAAFFDDKDWTVKRWTPEGTVVVNLKHMKWRAARPVMQYLCCGGDKDIFNVVEDAESVDELIDYMFDVMSVANELHIDRLILICSWIIVQHVWINNVCSVLADATHFHASALVQLLQEYITVNMEVFLESRLLEYLSPDLIKQLSVFVRAAQDNKYSLSRSSKIIDMAMETWGEWLALQDIPQPIVPTSRPGVFRDSAKLSPSGLSKRAARRSDASAPNSPVLRPSFSSRPVTSGIPDDEVFVMDDPDPAPHTAVPADVSAPEALSRVPRGSESPGRPVVGWKPITSAPKADMKAIMAEASTPSATTPVRPTENSVISRSFGSAGNNVPRVSSGSWRIPHASAATTPVSGSPVNPSTIASPNKNVRPQGQVPSTSSTSIVASGSHTALRSQPTTPRKPIAPGLGPVISPTRQVPATGSSIRRTSSGNVWTPPPVQPVQPVVQSSSRSVTSFMAIQLSQAEQDAAKVTKDKRSLVEIQEEERARQVEEEFLRWWSTEEERLKAEQAVAAALLVDPPKKPRKPKGGGHKGKGVAAVSGESQQAHKSGKGGHPGGEGAQKRQREKGEKATGESHGSSQSQASTHEQGRSQAQGQNGRSRKRHPAQPPGGGQRLPDAS